MMKRKLYSEFQGVVEIVNLEDDSGKNFPTFLEVIELLQFSKESISSFIFVTRCKVIFEGNELETKVFSFEIRVEQKLSFSFTKL